MKKVFGLLLIFLLSWQACRKDDDTDIVVPDDKKPPTDQPTPMQLDVPSHFRELIGMPIIPDHNPLTEEGVALGKKLYYDQLLSKDGPLQGFSCSSCHLQSNSFSKPNSGGNTNVIPHFNMAWSNQFLWDGKVEGILEDVMLFEVRDFFQVNMENIRKDSAYALDFKKAFNANSVEQKHLSYALTQFLRTMITAKSRYDNYLRIFNGEMVNEPTLNDQEIRGLNLYMSENKGDCFHCHGGRNNPLLTNNAYVNNGLDANPDSGLATYTKNPADLGKFKTPSLRNLVFTAPYMHDGRYATLEEVVDFYADDVIFSSPNLDNSMNKTRNLSIPERQDLVAFLKAITDSSYISDPAFRP